MRALVMAGVVLFACNQGPNPTKECGAGAEAFVKSVKLKAGADGTKLKPLVVKTCVDDHWTVEARRCLEKATTKEDRSACEDKHLTGDQRKKLAATLEPFAESRTAEAMAAMTKFKDKMCGCKEPKCAQDVSDEMTKWAQEMSKSTEEPPKMTEDDQKRAAAIGEEMGKCMQVAMSVETPGAPAGDVTKSDAMVAEAMVTMDKFKTKMCTCKDQKCATGVADEMTKWSQEQAKNQKAPPRMTEADQKKAAALGEEMGKCMQVAMEGKKKPGAK